MMCVKALPLFIIQILSTSASGISGSTGEIIGYSYIGITIFMLFCYSLIGYSRFSSRGSLMLVSQIFIFTQFCRFSALINFEHSDFFQNMWKTYSKAQDPSEFLSCSETSHIWRLIGFESNNFVCNSLAYLCLICALIVVWVVFFVTLKEKRQILYSFWVFLAYCSASDLSLSAFAQLSDLKFSGTIEIAGSVLAIFYLLLIVLLLCLQCFFIYQEKNESFLVFCIKEDFQPDKEYYFYYFYPLLLLKVLVHSCILVFGESKQYSTPIVVSIITLINFAYIISIRPFILTRHELFVHFIQVIEIIYMFLPIFYEFNAIPDLAIDLISIVLFVAGLSMFAIRSYMDYLSVKTSVNSQVHATSNLPVAVEDDMNGSSLELMKSKDNREGFDQTFKPDNFDNFSSNIRKENSARTDVKTFDEKEISLVKPAKKPKPAVFNFFDTPTPKSSDTNQKALEKTANFPLEEGNENVIANRPINYNSISGFNTNVHKPSQFSANSHRDQPTRPRINLNDITVKSRSEF